MNVNVLRTRVSALIVLSTTFLPITLGCKSKPTTRGIFLSTNLSIYSYMKAAALNNARGDGQLFFPQLQIFDPSGTLVYASHDPIDNSRLLASLPNGPQNMHSQPRTISLSKLAEEIPDFRARQHELLDGQKETLVSVFLEDCDGCSIQEEALKSNQEQLLGHNINLLVIHLARP